MYTNIYIYIVYNRQRVLEEEGRSSQVHQDATPAQLSEFVGELPPESRKKLEEALLKTEKTSLVGAQELRPQNCCMSEFNLAEYMIIYVHML